MLGTPVELTGLPAAIALYIPLFAGALGVSLACAAIQVFVRDLVQALGQVLPLLMFGAPIFYDRSLLPERVQGLLDLNPFTFYAEAFRVCRPGGTFAFFDCLRGEGPEPDYPLPWAESPTISFLHTPRETRAFISSAGFVEEEWVDLPPSLGPTPPLDGALSPATVFGSAMGPRMKNAAAAMADGRLKLALARFRKPE